MGLDVGVVSIEYLERPAQPIYRFLQALMADPDVGTDFDVFDYEPGWGDGWEGNAFYEFERDVLLRRADGWAVKNGLDATDRAALLCWVDDLPYRGDAIMLHLGN